MSGTKVRDAISANEKSLTSLNIEIEAKSTQFFELALSNDEKIEDQRHMFELAAKGNLQRFRNYYEQDPKRLKLRNEKSQTVLHVAAINGNEEVLLFALNQEIDVDAQDENGNTPLHAAAENRSKECADLLLQYNCDPTIANSQGYLPIHVACDLDYGDVLETMLQHENVNVNACDNLGNTPLHYCAAKDSFNCVAILLKHGAIMCQKCDIGYYPIHIAARNGSGKSLDLLIERVKTIGKGNVLCYLDRENNMPLHSSVHSGNLETVRVCLAAGARVDTQQDDGSTALHLACSQGSYEMVEIMYQLQKDTFTQALVKKDIQQMTPLHRATLFGHVPLMTFLLDHGADIESKDKQQRTPLLLAASQGCMNAAKYLAGKGADCTAKDKDSRNTLHLAIKGGISLAKVVEDPDNVKYMDTLRYLQNEKDKFGCTPLHYATQEGYLEALTDLLRLGASINSKNNDKESPLHFAARYGRYNTCRQLLQSQFGQKIINEIDGRGMSALHIAAQHGHVKILELLMKMGAIVIKDFYNNTPLHHAAANGYTKSMTLLLNIHCYLLDTQNRLGETALHLAAINGHSAAVTFLLTCGAKILKDNKNMMFYDHALDMKNSEVSLAAIQHNRWEEIINHPSELYGWLSLGLIKQLPDVCIALLDRCMTESDEDPKGKDYYVEYNFKYLQHPVQCMALAKKKKKTDYMPMVALNQMVTHGRVECLDHPLCVNYLMMKWNAYGMWIHTLSFFFYLVYLSCLTAFALDWTSKGNCSSPIWNNVTADCCPKLPDCNYIQMTSQDHLLSSVVIIYSIASLLKEATQVYQQKSEYFSGLSQSMEWLLYILSLVFICPFVFMQKSVDNQWDIGIMTVFIAWFNCLLYLQRFNFSGIYVVMFLEILATLSKVIVIFWVLIVAFAVTFFMSMSDEENKAYSTVPLSILKSVVMMLELDYMATFHVPNTDNRSDTLRYKTAFSLLILYVILMPILLMNLLIGLAVGDIESVRKDARLKQLAMQVSMYTTLEWKLPQKLLEKVDKVTYRRYPNRLHTYFDRMLNRFSGKNLVNEISNRNVYAHNLSQELTKQKQRLKSMQSLLEKQHDLLRMIGQKMEIRAEEDIRDEGDSVTECMGTQVKQKEKILSHWKSFSKRKK
ncbi:TRPA1 [Acanthosepion pharaonis]|uniref:TRPA1 n=1 Tax=Acanthosepion pharaonis TaxID=158019 RepID=A0A812ERD1_ACAPH|nr:TRPA1 [Sepia pharaonis]